MSIKITSNGTGAHDGIASQILCKLNALMFASFYGYDYVNIPFDDSFIKGNGPHRFGIYSTALQNLYFDFPGFEKVNPLTLNYDEIKLINFNDDYRQLSNPAEIRTALNKFIVDNSNSFKIFSLDNFFTIFNDKTWLYNKISRGRNLVVNPEFLSKNFHIGDDLKICVHIRRGDAVSSPSNQFRLNSIDYFNNVVLKVMAILNSRGVKFKINVHSEGLSENLDFEYEYIESPNPVYSFNDFLDADLIIASKSSHSSVPGMLMGQPVIYPSDSWFAPLPHWISADSAGVFDENMLILQLAGY